MLSIRIKLNQKIPFEQSEKSSMHSHADDSISTKTKAKLNNSIQKVVKNMFNNIKCVALSNTFYTIKATCKLMAMAVCHLGWSIYHLYFKHCEFPGRVGSVCINLGKIHEARNDKDIEAAHNLLASMKGNLNFTIEEDIPLEGRNIQGICFGTVLHLLANYNEKGIDKSFHSLEQLSDFGEGAPAEAVANQIIYEKMTLTKEGKKSIEPELKKYKINFSGKAQEEKSKIAAPFFLHVRENTLYELRGLKLEYCTEFQHVTFRKSDHEIYENLYKLAAGTYYLSLTTNRGSHAIAYIKHPDGRAHIFDPNKGTIRCHSYAEDHAVQLKKAINCYTCETDSQECGRNHRIEIKKASPLTLIP